jgi:AraC family ethanolamine operon transcriptional activator
MATDPCAVPIRTILDVDGAAAAMADGLETECVQLESRPFVVQHAVVALPEMFVQFVREDVAIARRIRVPDDKWVFIVPQAVSETARWNARRVDGRDLFVQGPGSACYAFDPAGTEFAIISVADGTEAGLLARRLLGGSRRECLLLTRERDAEALRRRLDQVLAPPSAASDPATVQRRLFDALAIAVRHAIPSEQRVYLTAAYKRVVGRAEEFFRLHAGQRFSAGQLSSAVRVSERHLRNAFYDVYATSPMRYFRLWQLNQARRALQSQTRRAATVTDVALSYGFVELGRFAGAYKALFGESPSKTLGHRPWL